jgi:hypothetical protein
MEAKVASLETEIALMKNDILTIKHKEAQLPIWLRRSAVALILAVFSQTIAVVWWASSLSANVENISKEVKLNTAFRVEFPTLHEEVMVKLAIIEVQNLQTQEFIKSLR